MLVFFMERQILHVDVNNAFLSWLAVYMLKNNETKDGVSILALLFAFEFYK